MPNLTISWLLSRPVVAVVRKKLIPKCSKGTPPKLTNWHGSWDILFWPNVFGVEPICKRVATVAGASVCKVDILTLWAGPISIYPSHWRTTMSETKGRTDQRLSHAIFFNDIQGFRGATTIAPVALGKVHVATSRASPIPIHTCLWRALALWRSWCHCCRCHSNCRLLWGATSITTIPVWKIHIATSFTFPIAIDACYWLLSGWLDIWLGGGTAVASITKLEVHVATCFARPVSIQTGHWRATFWWMRRFKARLWQSTTCQKAGCFFFVCVCACDMQTFLLTPKKTGNPTQLNQH